jgi:hypothetical protein
MSDFFLFFLFPLFSSLSLTLTRVRVTLQNYFGDPWNVFDCIIVMGSFVDILYSELNVSFLLPRISRLYTGLQVSVPVPFLGTPNFIIHNPYWLIMHTFSVRISELKSDSGCGSSV